MSEEDPLAARIARMGAAARREAIRNNYETALVNQLNDLPPQQAHAGLDTKEELLNKKKQAKVDKANQQNTLRSRFFVWFACLASFILVTNCAIFSYYVVVRGGQIPQAVMLSWISATVVEVLGIVYIMAQYLFPKPKSSRNESSTSTQAPPGPR